MEAVFVDYLSDPPSEIYQFVIYTMTLVLIISFNYVLDRFQINASVESNKIRDLPDGRLLACAALVVISFVRTN